MNRRQDLQQKRRADESANQVVKRPRLVGMSTVARDWPGHKILHIVAPISLQRSGLLADKHGYLVVRRGGHSRFKWPRFAGVVAT
jgi:hypothetical protein